MRPITKRKYTPRYPVSVEITGPIGMFAAPDGGSDGYSLPLPPPQACVGIIESVALVLGVRIVPVAAAVCGDVRLTRFGQNNSVGSEKKPVLLQSGDSWQVREAILERPTLQIVADLETPEELLRPGHNPAHAMQEIFLRRLCKGRCFRTPSLGRREMFADWFGSPRSPVNGEYSQKIPIFPVGRFGPGGGFVPDFREVEITGGVAVYEPDRAARLGRSKLGALTLAP